MPEVTDEAPEVLDDMYVVIGEVEVDKVDDEIGEINGGNGDKEECDIVGDKIGEKHDEVGGQEVEVEVGVSIEVLEVVLLVAGFSVKQHILLIFSTGCSAKELNPPLFGPYVPHQS